MQELHYANMKIALRTGKFRHENSGRKTALILLTSNTKVLLHPFSPKAKQALAL
jgi:hypothetical protein